MIFIVIVFYSLYALGVVSPKNIDRTENIKQRLQLAEAKLKGVYSELNEYHVDVDEELDEIIEETQTTLKEISEKIEGILKLKNRLQHFKEKK